LELAKNRIDTDTEKMELMKFEKKFTKSDLENISNESIEHLKT
jgi:hypothetical protein